MRRMLAVWALLAALALALAAAALMGRQSTGGNE